MKKHVDLVGTLYMIAGGLTLLVALSMLSLGLGAVALTGSGGSVDVRQGIPVLLAVGAFAALAGIAFVWAVAHLWSGMALRRCGPWARAIAIVLAVLNLFVLPFGTALGIYALWVLMNEQTRPLFHPEHA
jgi:hypothetical protein